MKKKKNSYAKINEPIAVGIVSGIGFGLIFSSAVFGILFGVIFYIALKEHQKR